MNMLYIFDQNEQFQAVYKPEAFRSHETVLGDFYFMQAAFPALNYKTVVASACPFWDAVHTEKMTTENTLTFTVPADHSDSQYVTEGNLVAFRDLDNNWQLFEIKRVTDVHGDGLTRTAYCEHAFYELVDDFITDKRPQNCDATYALGVALQGTRWQVGTVDNLGTSSTNFYYESALSAVQKVATTWKGELQFRVSVTGGVITGRYVDLLAQRGADTGKQFAYGRHTKSIQREVDLSGVVTAMYGRGKGIEVSSDGYGRKLNFADVVWTTPTNPVNKPAGQEWVGDPDALARWGRPGGRHRFGVYNNDNQEDPVALLQETWDQLQSQKEPAITYALDVLDLERVAGYEHEKVRLGDTVRVIDRVFSPELLVEARVIEIDRDLIQPQNTKVVLGNFAPNIAYSVGDISKEIEDIKNNPVHASWLEGEINALQNMIRAGHGTVSITDNNGIMIVDDANNPTKAIRLIGGALAIANGKNEVTGDWNWRTFGTGDGFLADLMIAGTMLADRIKGGTLTLGGFNNEGGVLSVRDPSNVEIVKADSTGITVNGGSYFIIDRGIPCTLVSQPNLLKDSTFDVCTSYYDSNNVDPTYYDAELINASWGTSGLGLWVGNGRAYVGPSNMTYPRLLFGQRTPLVNGEKDVNNIYINAFYQSAPLRPGIPHTFSIYHKKIIASNFRSTIYSKLRVTIIFIATWLNGGMPTQDPIIIRDFESSSDDWIRSSITFTKPNDAAGVKIILSGPDGSSDWIYISGAQLVEGSYPTIYNPSL